MRVFSKVGTIVQTFVPDDVQFETAGYVLMQGERPDIFHIATIDGNWVVNKEKVIQRSADHIREKLNNAAQSLGFDSIYTAVTYADEPAVPLYQQGGAALRQWRSLLWKGFYDAVTLYKSDEIDEAGLLAAVTNLPAFSI